VVDVSRGDDCDRLSGSWGSGSGCAVDCVGFEARGMDRLWGGSAGDGIELVDGDYTGGRRLGLRGM
jgi:hypothetical protein